MLDRLSIDNYALIDHLDIEPGEGLSIITGETGAGKSIMLGALGLLKGDRADSKVISEKDKKSVVEALFSGFDSSLVRKLEDNDIEADEKELILRREITPSGRSRAFINDTPVNLSLLGEITKDLFDIHSQNSNSLLSDQKTQLELLDGVTHSESLLAEYEKDFAQFLSLRQKIKKLREEEERNREQEEVIAFKLSQLDRLKPKAGELKNVELKYETLSNSEEVRSRLSAARGALASDGSGALDMLETALSNIQNINFSLWEEDENIQSRLRQCIIEIKDISETVENIAGEMEYDPKTIQSLSDRMNAYYTAFKTFKVGSDIELESLQETLRKQYDSLEGGSDERKDFEKEAKEIAKNLKRLAQELTERRKEGAISLQKEIETEARRLGLDNLRFGISIEEAKLSRTGGDKVEFLASFNKNQALRPVGSIASGGEMARLMLAIKNITSKILLLPTIIFDEIDTGVSGHIADRMGEMMKEMGSRMQILTITHLPQVAAKGRRHFKVFKEDREEKTVSDVMLLDEPEREMELARMLSGEKINEAALTNARSLLSSATENH